MSEFVHLHVHSEYSLLDGAARIDALAKRAAELGMSALALTDHGVMYGAIPFYRACKKAGIRPIIGCEFYYTSDDLHKKGSRQEQPIYHMTVLAKNETGYNHLMKLCTIAQLQGFHYRPRIDWAHLSQYAEGLICLSGCMQGEIAQLILRDRAEEALAVARRYQALFGDNYYLELQDHGILEQKRIAQGLISISEQTGIPLVVTNDVHYLFEQEHELQDILLCIGTGKSIDDPDRFRITSSQGYMKSEEEMARLFPHLPEAMANTKAIADKCELELTFGVPVLPAYSPIPDGLSASSFLKQRCEEGLLDRYADTAEWAEQAFREQATARLHYELSVIGNMGFDDYFLIVWDFIKFAHHQGIAVGPGRGSSAGSLVAYCLRITDVDPLRYGLLFERFLNPERVTMPDIDIDFSDERRDEVIAYVMHKYGDDRVAQIITFGTMQAKAAVRDVGRVLNMSYGEVDRVAKLIPNQLRISLEEALAQTPELRKLQTSHPQTDKLLTMAKQVEGMPRHASTHAAGVVISREALVEYVPLQRGSEETALTQYAMEHLEAIGLLKMDFLGLRTLSIIERTERWVEENTGTVLQGKQHDYKDEPTYALLEKGDTTGIFQLESTGCRKVLRELKPSNFEDIVSVLALYRPGPMEFIPQFIEGRHGRVNISYPHPVLEPILQDTYGIIVYQEQIMQIASRMAGFSLGEADLLRRAISKKNREILDRERAHFRLGCVAEGYSEEDADRVYDMIVRFADYGFCRAHATAYGVLSYRTAFLKANYPFVFMASMLTAVMGNHRKVAEYVDECRRMGIAVLPPDVNESGVLFTPIAALSKTDGDEEAEEKSAIRFGLGAIKNVGTQAIESIMKERAQDPFKSLLDFCQRVDLRVCNKRVIESLIQSGAMDSLQGHRAQMLFVLDEVVESATKWKKQRDDLQLHLFGFTEEVNWRVEYPVVPELTMTEKLEFERELLGFYLSGHPLDGYSAMLRRFELDPLHQLHEYADGSEVIVAGRVVGLKLITTKKGMPMAFIELEDRVERIEVVLFPEAWRQASDFVDKGSLLMIRGKLQIQEELVKLLADQVSLLDNAAEQTWRKGQAAKQAVGQPKASSGGEQRSVPRKLVEKAEHARNTKQRVFIKITQEHDERSKLVKLQQLLQNNSGPLEVVLYYEQTQKTLMLSEQYKVKPSPALFTQVEQLLGTGAIKVNG